MTAIIIGLSSAALIAATAITLLILLRIGIHHQERSGSLNGRPKSLSAALARRVLDLHACPPADAQRRGANDRADASRKSAHGK